MELCASSIEVTSSVVHRNDDLRSFWLPVWEKRSGIRLLDSLNRVKNECFEDLKIGQIFVSASNFNYNEFVKKLGGLDERARGSGTKTAIIAAVLSWVYKDQQPSGLTPTLGAHGWPLR